MRRVLACVATAGLLLIVGCGRSYETRLQANVKYRKYQQRLGKLLTIAPGDPYKKEGVYIRPPKPLESSKAFPFESAALFDIAGSFDDPQKQAAGLRLHVVARREKPKAAPGKNAPPPPDTSNRGPFQGDLLALLGDYGNADAVNSGAFKTASEGKNSFKRLIFTSGTNQNKIEVYLYQQKPYDVALIWDIPSALEKDPTISESKSLTLQTFAVGAKAQRLYAGGADDEGGGAAPGAEGGGGGQVF
jgi:hypothetical protein